MDNGTLNMITLTVQQTQPSINETIQGCSNIESMFATVDSTFEF